MNLRKIVIDRIEQIGPKEASKLFGVSAGTISNWANGKTDPSIQALELVLADSDSPIQELSQSDDEAEVAQWSGKDVILLLPVYRSFSPDTHYTLFANYAKYGPEKVGMIQEKRTIIYESRNILAHKFLKTDAKYGIMVDDDMILPCGNAALFNQRYKAGVSEVSAGYNAISRLVSHSKDRGIVGALYFGRHSEGRPQCYKGFHDTTNNYKFRDGTYNGLMPDEWVGTGCMRITRDTLLAMKEEIDKGRWPECAPRGKDGWYGFFTPLGTRIGEDVSFCRRAKEIGIQPYVDASLICLHNGECNYGPKNTTG